MKIVYAIEKEIEVADGMTDKEIDKVISNLCDDENGSNYTWIEEEKRKRCVLRYLF